MGIFKILRAHIVCLNKRLETVKIVGVMLCLFLVLFGNTYAEVATTGHHRGLYTNYIEDAYETIPVKVTEKGQHLSHNLTSHHNEDENDIHYFNVTIHDIEHFLVLKPNKKFLSPGVIFERRNKNVHVQYRPKRNTRSCHYHGEVYGEENSVVSISACNGLTGIIVSKSGKYYIEPGHQSVKTVRPGHKHLIYKRSAVISNQPKRKRKRKRKKHQSRNCATREPKRMTLLEWQKEIGKIQVQERKHKQKRRIDIPSVEMSEMKKHKYKKIGGRREKRSYSKPQYVEALIVADSTMVEFHESGDIETYLLTIMNMVSSLYLDSSIGNLINVAVVKIILIDDPQSEPDLNITINADATLRSFCKWQRNLNHDNDTHPHHHDVAILITRRDICSHHNSTKLCNTLGVAHIGGMCKRERSCSVNEDSGISLAHTIAHEMGHNFGMYHDTEEIGCQGMDGKAGHIMAPSFLADSVEINWSRCSRRDITKFLDKGLGTCLQDEPTDIIEYKDPELPAGAMYNGDHQCRLQFGEDAEVCSYTEDICARLWCSVNETCSSQLRPAAAGTNCGKHKWCQNLKCVPIVEPPLPIDGGWGEWSSWSDCSRTCGAGVSITERSCDHPKPAYGGKFCVGERRKYRICNTEDCLKSEPTFRSVQCSNYNNKTYKGHTYTWIPYFDEANPCELYCSDVNETVIVPWGEFAADGTSCNLGTRDICISGICRQVGCDWVVGSTAVEDKCGICQGDGTKCDLFAGSYYKQSYSPGYREVVVIPPGARNIRIQEKNATANYISLGSAYSRKFFLNGKRHITLPGEYTVAGAQAMYKRDHQQEKIHIPGPITEPIVVYILFRGKIWNPGVEYNYSMWKKETTKQVQYVWVLGLWSQCSATCGGGTQKRKPLCQEKTVSSLGTNLDGFATIVDEINCDTEQPGQLMRTCNDDPCPSNWWVGPWQSCPVTCAREDDRHMMRRSVMCVDGQQVALPDHYCDKKAKPMEYTKCNSLPVCVD